MSDNTNELSQAKIQEALAQAREAGYGEENSVTIEGTNIRVWTNPDPDAENPKRAKRMYFAEIGEGIHNGPDMRDFAKLIYKEHVAETTGQDPEEVEVPPSTEGETDVEEPSSEEVQEETQEREEETIEDPKVAEEPEPASKKRVRLTGIEKAVYEMVESATRQHNIKFELKRSSAVNKYNPNRAMFDLFMDGKRLYRGMTINEAQVVMATLGQVFEIMNDQNEQEDKTEQAA